MMTLLVAALVANPVAVGWYKSSEAFRYGDARVEMIDFDGAEATKVDDIVIDTVSGQRTVNRNVKTGDEEMTTEDYVDWVSEKAKALLVVKAPARTQNDLSAHVEEISMPASGRCGGAERRLVLKVQDKGVTTQTTTVAFSSKVEPYFSPDGSRIAWVMDDAVRIVPTHGPVMSMTASKADTKAARKLARSLESKGFVTVRMTEAIKARDKNVVYARPAVTKQAEALAALLPNGATVEPITWETPAEIVIALGKGSVK